MEAGSRRTGQTAWTIAALYTDAFRADLKALNINEPDVWCKATDHIAEQIASSRRSRKGLHLSHQRRYLLRHCLQPSYGYLGRLDIAGLQAGARVDLGEKKNATDYALWKFRPNEKRQMGGIRRGGVVFPAGIEVLGDGAQVPRQVLRHPLRRRDHITVHHPMKFRRRRRPTARASRTSGCMVTSSCSTAPR